jgi:hypothetical protein
LTDCRAGVILSASSAGARPVGIDSRPGGKPAPFRREDIMARNTRLSDLLEGRKVDSVRQRGDELDIDFKDGSTLSLRLATASTSIRLADDDDKDEYSG